MYAMRVKMTLCVSEELKAAVEREARRRGVPEAEVINRALAVGLSRPSPRAGIIDGPVIAGRANELDGFGTR